MHHKVAARRQNEKLSFFVGKKGDAWLHARNVPGAHVVVKNDHSRGRRSAEDIGPKTLPVGCERGKGYYEHHQHECPDEICFICLQKGHGSRSCAAKSCGFVASALAASSRASSSSSSAESTGGAA